MVECQEHYLDVGGVTLCWFEWGQKRKGEDSILLVHATGFHARCWDKTVAGLGDRHVIAIDQRGHGRSDNTPFDKWDQFGADLAGFITQLGLSNLVGVGHSMGGFALALAASQLKDVFSQLILFDPVVMDPAMYTGEVARNTGMPIDSIGHPVARRRNSFSGPDEMFDALRPKGGYGIWQEAVMRDYCQYGLLPAEEGEGYQLACPPEFEASVYMGSSGTNIYEAIAEVKVPVFIVRAKGRKPDQVEMDFSLSPTWEHLATRFPQGHDNYRPDLSHYIPMQDPEFAARYILTQNN